MLWRLSAIDDDWIELLGVGLQRDILTLWWDSSDVLDSLDTSFSLDEIRLTFLSVGTGFFLRCAFWLLFWRSRLVSRLVSRSSFFWRLISDLSQKKAVRVLSWLSCSSCDTLTIYITSLLWKEVHVSTLFERRTRFFPEFAMIWILFLLIRSGLVCRRDWHYLRKRVRTIWSNEVFHLFSVSYVSFWTDWFFVMTVVLFGIDASILWRDFVTISENRIYSSSCRMFLIRLDFLYVRSLLYEYILWMKITMNFRVGISSTTLLLFYVFFFFRCAIRRLLYDFPSERACLCFDRNSFHLMSSSLFLRPLQGGEL